MKKINILILVIQIIGINFIILAGRVFSNLTDIKFAEIMNSLKPNDNIIEFANRNQIEGLQISDFIQRMMLFEIIGLLIGLVISYYVIKSKKVSMLNFASLFIISLILLYKKILFNPFKFINIGNYFESFRPLVIFNGSILLTVALILFFISAKLKIKSNENE